MFPFNRGNKRDQEHLPGSSREGVVPGAEPRWCEATNHTKLSEDENLVCISVWGGGGCRWPKLLGEPEVNIRCSSGCWLVFDTLYFYCVCVCEMQQGPQTEDREHLCEVSPAFPLYLCSENGRLVPRLAQQALLPPEPPPCTPPPWCFGTASLYSI